MTTPDINPACILAALDVLGWPDDRAASAHVEEDGFEVTPAGHYWDTMTEVLAAARDADDAEAAADLIERLTAERDQARARIELLGAAVAMVDEILRHITEHGHPGRSAMRTGWINTETVARWRTTLMPLRTIVDVTAREAAGQQGEEARRA